MHGSRVYRPAIVAKEFIRLGLLPHNATVNNSWRRQGSATQLRIFQAASVSANKDMHEEYFYQFQVER